MSNDRELYHTIYSFLLTQIQFGFYGFAESLPTMEEICRQSCISLDTIKPAYHRLHQEGYLSLSQKTGTRVAVQYSPEEIDRHVRDYFSCRRASIIDLSQSIWPLFGWAQWLSLKHSPPETAEQMESLTHHDVKSPNIIWQLLAQQYGALGNHLLTRLMRSIFLFFQGPFYSAAENYPYLTKGIAWQHVAASLCRHRDWDTLADTLKTAQDELSYAVLRFYEEHAADSSAAEEQIDFNWSSYQKSSQLRYSLAVELLTGISRGQYPTGSYLPTAGQLSAEKGVSVSTIRRTVSLLNSIGAVKSSRTLGALVLPPEQSTENCDFSRPEIRRRLLDLTESLQIYALSSKAVSELTLASLDAASLCRWKQRLSELHHGRRYELITYTSLELISQYAPSCTIRTIYSELLRLLFWGNPLRGTRGTPTEIDRFFSPPFCRMLQSLEEKRFTDFSATLEELLLHELRFAVNALIQLGMEEVRSVLIPGKDDIWSHSFRSPDGECPKRHL